ncbi:hypothetical protein Ancab_029122 [Ancistrocladus abbreviatus]
MDKVEEKKKIEDEEFAKLKEEKDQSNVEMSELKEELEMAKKTYEQRYQQLEAQAKSVRNELEQKVKEQQQLLDYSKNKAKELEANAESKIQTLSKKEHVYESLVNIHFAALRELRHSSESIKQELLKTQKSYLEELNRLAHSIHPWTGNIRVYCRVRPFLPGEIKREMVIEYIDENGEIVIANPSKQGKDGQKSFKFNKVFGPAATQAKVFSDTQPLIRTVLDGFNVCIFAYGQTGSGKTHTMTGPEGATKENWGVNYRALDDLFQISEDRKSYFRMLPVRSTSDVIELMRIGHNNRAVSATAMNERSSRSHSVVTIHVQGTDLKTGAASRGSLHLVDLAGSERVDRSEATGDRLREAQHINKSLSALGDVIFALAQKSPHVPYRNSKLTQVLQSSLGGRAKTLMFVQVNPDGSSFPETVSTLKFAERVSGVELGAAKSNKEGRDVRELMEQELPFPPATSSWKGETVLDWQGGGGGYCGQVASLKDVIAKKDEEIERLQVLKDPRSPPVKRTTSSLRYGSLSSSTNSIGSSPQRSPALSGGKCSGLLQKAGSDQDNCTEYNDKNSDAGSQQFMDDVKQKKRILRPSKSMNDLKHQKESHRQTKLAGGYVGQNISADDDVIGFGDADSEERLSELSDGDLSVGTETDGACGAKVLAEGSKQSNNAEENAVK